MNFEDILSHFRSVSGNGGQYRADCPACGDTKQHLYIKQEGGKVLFDCKKGCTFSDIIRAAGLSESDCFPEKEQKSKWTLLREHIYTDEKGASIAKKQIYDTGEGKTAIWYRLERGQYIKGLNGTKLPLYHLHKLVSSSSETIVVVEGEKDVETAEKMGFTATTSPNGAGAKWRDEYCPYFSGKNVCIIMDNDEPGEGYGCGAASKIRKYAKAVKLIRSADIYPSLKPKGDISDIAAEIGIEETKRLILEAMKKTAENNMSEQAEELPPYIYAEIDRTGKTVFKLNLPRLAEYFRKNQNYFWLKSQGKKPVRHLYKNGVYLQASDEEIKAIIIQYITKYLPYSLKMRDVDEVFKIICCDNVSFDSDKIDADENIINFENGLLYLDTMELKPHTPEVLSTIQIPCKWNPSAGSAPIFKQFLNTLTSGNKEVQRFLMQFIGVAISNIYGYRMKSALFMVGAGNTGKSQLKGLVEKLIGTNNCTPRDLKDLEERFGTSSLYGKRLIGSSDMSFVTIKELRRFKIVTGGDSVIVEFKGNDLFSYVYRGLVWFCTNQLPKFGGDRGEHVYNRIITVRCDNVIPPEKQDKHLLEKMYSERESIVCAAVYALKTVIENGYRFDVPEVCNEEKERYKVENSPVLTFYEECCCERKTTIDKCTCSKMHEVFKAWCKGNGGYVPTKQMFRRELADKYGGGDIANLEKNVHGIRYYKFTLTKETKEAYANIYGHDL